MQNLKNKLQKNNRIIGNRIKKARLSLGISKHELAEDANISVQQLSEYEKGIDYITISNFLKK